MVEEIPPPGDSHNDDRAPRWIRRLVLGALGISAVVRLLIGGRRGQLPAVIETQPEPVEEEIRYPDGRIEHPGVQYEHHDASFRGVVFVLVGLMCLASFHFYMVLWFYHSYSRYQAGIKKSPFPLAAGPSQELPREPHLEQLDRLEESQRSNVYAREASKEQVLQSYGRTAEKGFVHIPIDRAMELLADKLPARKGQPGTQSKANGLVDSGASNSGRMFRKEAP
jgi:hypothetical protein